MKPEKLAPIRDRDSYSKIMAKKLEFELYARIYQPILEIFGLSLRQVAPGRTNSNQRTNAKGGSLYDAILAGKITFANGVFKGQFTAAISKEIKAMGGTFDKRQKAWVVKDMAKAPVQTKMAIGQAREESRSKIEKAHNALDKAEAQIQPPLDLSDAASGILDDLHKQFEETTAKKLEIPMAMSGFIESELKDTYTENLNLYIKQWSDEAIVRLRGQIQANAEQGYRASNMVEAIRAEYGVSQNKAKFLARQETSLLVSKYRENNYKEAGIPMYQWSTSHDGRVRPVHKELNGEIFRWDSPPIVDPKKGRRAHPGEDFGCRCIAIPILANQLTKVEA